MIELLIDKDYYFPGDTIEGIVRVIINKPRKIRDINIVFGGKEFARVTRNSGNEKEIYTRGKVITIKWKTIFKSRNPDEKSTMHSEIPFSFTIPWNAPPSVEAPFLFTLPEDGRKIGVHHQIRSKKSGWIRYELKAIVNIHHGLNPKKKTTIRVVPLPIVAGFQSPAASHQQLPSGMVSVTLAVDENEVSPGSVIRGEIFLNKKTPSVKIRSLEVSLKFHYFYTANYTDLFKQTVDRVVFKEMKKLFPGSENSCEFKLRVPPDVPFTTRGLIVQLLWFVDVKVSIPMKKPWHLVIPVDVLPCTDIDISPLLNEVLNHYYGDIDKDEVDVLSLFNKVLENNYYDLEKDDMNPSSLLNEVIKHYHAEIDKDEHNTDEQINEDDYEKFFEREYIPDD
ncbi:MAG: sporulation protein [Promethearchaeota archaeon]